MTGYGALLEHTPALLEHPTITSEFYAIIINRPQVRDHMNFNIEGIHVAGVTVFRHPITLPYGPPFSEG